MNTKEILQAALDLAGISETPADSGVLVEGDSIKRLYMGVDVDTAELLLARQLGADAVLAHHPAGGSTRVDFHNVMESQIDHMVKAGVPINKAQKALKDKMGEVERRDHAGNYDRVVSAARLLRMPLVGIHRPADILSEQLIQVHLEQKLGKNPKARLKHLLSALSELPEFQAAETKPAIRVGSEDDFTGKIWVAMAGGTNGGVKVIKAYFEAGIGTLVVMHMPEDVLKEVREQGIGNVVVAGHMASDSVGLNILAKAFAERGLEVIRGSGIVTPGAR